MAFGPRILGYVAMSYEDLVAEYREAYSALQNLSRIEYVRRVAPLRGTRACLPDHLLKFTK